MAVDDADHKLVSHRPRRCRRRRAHVRGEEVSGLRRACTSWASAALRFSSRLPACAVAAYSRQQGLTLRICQSLPHAADSLAICRPVLSCGRSGVRPSGCPPGVPKRAYWLRSLSPLVSPVGLSALLLCGCYRHQPGEPDVCFLVARRRRRGSPSVALPLASPALPPAPACRRRHLGCPLRCHSRASGSLGLRHGSALRLVQRRFGRSSLHSIVGPRAPLPSTSSPSRPQLAACGGLAPPPASASATLAQAASSGVAARPVARGSRRRARGFAGRPPLLLFEPLAALGLRARLRWRDCHFVGRRSAALACGASSGRAAPPRCPAH